MLKFPNVGRIQIILLVNYSVDNVYAYTYSRYSYICGLMADIMLIY